MNAILTIRAVAAAGLLMAASAQAADSGFLTDYSKLKSAQGQMAARMYLAPDVDKRAKSYRGVFVDQPEIFISPNSKYKGMKPDDAKIIADVLRESINAELQGGSLMNLNAPQAGSLTIRIALSDLMVQKKKRGLLSYTPIGFVVHAGKTALSSVMSNIDVKSATVELEIIDSATGEVLAAAVEPRGNAGGGAAATNWDDLQAYLSTVGKRVACRLENAQKAEGARADCAALTVPVPKKKK